MAHGTTLTLRAMETWKERRQRYVPLRRGGEPRVFRFPGDPVVYRDEGRGIRRLGRFESAPEAISTVTEEDS